MEYKFIQGEINMKMKFDFCLFVVVAGIALSSCVTRLGAFTVISTKNIDWSRTSEFTRYNQRVSGEDVYHIIIFIPTKFNVNIEEAVDKALEKVPGGIALVDAVLKSKFFWIPYIYGNSGYMIEGSVLMDPKLVSVDEQHKSKYLVFYTNDGNEFIRRDITEEEYRNYL
jgi:hypothetical protein